MEKCVAPSLLEFTQKLANYYPITYRKALDWVHLEDLPTWPRHGQERFKVKIGIDLENFLKAKGLAEEKIKKFIKSL